VVPCNPKILLNNFILTRNHGFRWRSSCPLPPKRRSLPKSRPLWLNGWMDQDGIWNVGGPRSRPRCARWEPSSPLQKGTEAAPSFGPFLLWPNGCMHQDTSTEVGLSLGDIVLDGDPAPLPQRGTAPNFWPMSVVAKRLD